MNATMYCLTEAQVDDHLIGDLAAEAGAHLAGCALCQARVRAAEEPLASFHEVSLAWAERQSATMPVPAVAATRRPGHRWAWATAATAALAIGVALPIARERAGAYFATPSAPAQTMAAVSHTGMTSVTPVTATPEQIARDNAMLEAIDRELDAPVQGPSQYGLLAGGERGHAHMRTVRD